MSSYRLYLQIKRAAEEEAGYQPDSILRHPFRGRAPKDLDELADRRANLLFRTGAGALLGTVAGGTAGVLGGKLLDHALARDGYTGRQSRYLPAAFGALGLIGGLGVGASAGGAYHTVRRLIGNADEHRQALKDYYAHGGRPLPFAVEHPYLTTAGIALGAPVMGSAAGMGIARSLGQPMLHGLAGANAFGTLGGLLLHKHFSEQRAAALPHVKLKPNETPDDSLSDQQADMI